MIASVLIEYNVSSLDKTFDYKVPDNLCDKLKIGNKVKVPFGNKILEGFVLNISKKVDVSFEYKEIIDIVESDFYLKKDLLELGVFMSKKTLSTLISCYQIMLPSALKAKVQTNIKRKYEYYVDLNKNVDIDEYIANNKRRVKENEIINILKKGKCLKKVLACSSLNNLINNNIVLVSEVEVNREVSSIQEKNKDIILTVEQKEVYEKIVTEEEKDIFLLHGVTGSGKTEIYINLIKDGICRGRTSIMLVPEISLTPQIVSRFKNVFGGKVAVLHSKLSNGEKYDEYRRIMNKEVDAVIGARSALFAPLDNIGYIIIDECQSTTYKQESSPKYNAIDMAIERSKAHKAKCILGSATPSLEQYAKGLKGVYKLIQLDKRISSNLPSIKLVDMSIEAKKRNFIISSQLDKEIKNTLEKGEQIILLLNRRGYSTFISCSNCGYVYKCPNCDISMIYHKSTNNLTCHYCGYMTKMSNICPKCYEEAIKDLGLGTEKLEEIINKKYNARVLRMDADTTMKKNSYNRAIEDFKNHKYDILIGTQMVSKGLNFPDVSLVGVLNIDASLAIPDFRSGEKTFELLLQTAGRSARYEKSGKVLIQTYNPDNYVFSYVLKNNYKMFFNYEMSIRKKLNYPPYYNIATIKIISEDYNLAKEESKKIKLYLSKKLNEKFLILGPSTDRIFRLKNNFNFNVLIKYKYEENLGEVLQELKQNFINKKVKIDMDIKQ